MKLLIAVLTVFLLSGCNKEDIIAFLENNVTTEQSAVTSDIYAEVNQTAATVSDYGDFTVYTVNPLEWEYATITETDTLGIVKKSYVQTYEKDDYGKKAEKKYIEQLDKLKGDVTIQFIEEHDECIGNTFSCEDKHYQYALYMDRRFKQSYFMDGTFEINLFIDDDGYTKTKVVLEIVAPEFYFLDGAI